MDPLTGALVAAGVAWVSILLAALLPVRPSFVRRLRGAGAVSLLLVGLALLGAPVPGALPLFVLAAGVGWAALASREREPLAA